MLKENIIINSDKQNLDIPFIHDFITHSYWAKGRTLEEVKICIENSLNFGVYIERKQIGYARVVTDYFSFAYLLDVFIDINHRKKGYSILLIEHILNCESLKKVKSWKLATSDAHSLYRKFGFKNLAHPEKMMEMVRLY